MLRIRPFLLLPAILLAGARPGAAHKPLFDEPDSTSFEDAQHIRDPQVSYAIYANLSAPDDIDFYALDVRRPMPLYAGLLVPCRRGYRDFYPAYAIVGPGLPAPDCDLPFALPDGHGALVVIPAPVKPRPTFYEPFTSTRYYEGIPETEQRVETRGTYYLVIWHPTGETGGYTAVVGREEKWQAKDIFPTLKAVERIQQGAWMGERSAPAEPAPSEPGARELP